MAALDKNGRWIDEVTLSKAKSNACGMVHEVGKGAPHDNEKVTVKLDTLLESGAVALFAAITVFHKKNPSFSKVAIPSVFLRSFTSTKKIVAGGFVLHSNAGWR